MPERDHIYRTERMNELRVRVGHEMMALREELQKLPPKDILERAYEFTLKNEFFLAIDRGDFTSRKIDMLLTFEYPLYAVYQEWLQQDLSFDPILRDSLELTIENQEDFLNQSNSNLGEAENEDNEDLEP